MATRISDVFRSSAFCGKKTVVGSGPVDAREKAVLVVSVGGATVSLATLVLTKVIADPGAILGGLVAKLALGHGFPALSSSRAS